jgi:hypothetical protein
MTEFILRTAPRLKDLENTQALCPYSSLKLGTIAANLGGRDISGDLSSTRQFC